MEDTPYGRGVFSKATDPFLRKLYIEKIAPPGKKENLMSAAKGVALIRQRTLAFLAEENSIYQGIEETFFEHEKCGLVGIRRVDEKFRLDILSIVLRSA